MSGAHRAMREPRQLHLPQVRLPRLPERARRVVMIAESLLLIAAAFLITWLVRNPPDPAPPPPARPSVTRPAGHLPCTQFYGPCRPGQAPRLIP